jgi:hypothetical protein
MTLHNKEQTDPPTIGDGLGRYEVSAKHDSWGRGGFQIPISEY